MLRVVPHKSAAAARQYYTEGLKREDYYTKGQEAPGLWHGKAAALLGLSGRVEHDAFVALVENRHPATGKRLTPRTKAERIVGYDLTFNAPKSLSVLHAFTQDEGLLQAFRSAVAATMAEIEEEMATRVRGRGRMEDRVTGNMAWAEFVHFTARPVGGIPDMHLHVHAFAMNVTWDGTEDRWKAGKFRDIKKNASYSEAVFHSHLTSKLTAEGYAIERNAKGWEIKGVPESVLAKFSRRNRQVNALAELKGITDPKLKEALVLATREGKRRGLTQDDLRAAWNARLTEEERVALSKVRPQKGQGAGRRITAVEAVTYALDKRFAKNSVVPANALIQEALRVGVGQLTPDTVRQEMLRRDLLVREVKGELLCTSLEALAEEVALISFVRGGRGRMAPLAQPGWKIPDYFSAEQQRAVRHALESKDQFVAIQGKAGVGKTTTLKAVVAAIEANGKRVYAFAPSADASRGTLREEEFADADTIAHLLINEALQKRLRGQVVLIDEAGTIGTRDLWRVAQALGPSTKIILTGDTRQHNPVPRGDPFRLLLEYAGLPAAEITHIRRQELELYRKAIEALSNGDMRTGFRRLEALGAFVEIKDEAERHRALAEDYLALSKGGTPPLVVSPTHREGGKVTEAIRTAKREAKRLGPERSFLQYHNLQWEEADRALPENYTAGLMVQYNQNAKA
jgi:conjugative relaxase-like TrwC/TraI family protein